MSSRSTSARASCSVAAIVGETTKSSLMSSGLRPGGFGAGADVVAVFLHSLDPGADGDDRVGGTGGELAALRRRTGLQEGGPVLR